MTYAIIGTSTVGTTLANLFGAKNVAVSIANSRGPDTIAELAKQAGSSVRPATVDEALEADVIIFAVGFLDFKDVALKRADWTGKVVVDVTNAFMLPQEVQAAELKGRLSSEVNADKVPGAKLVKAFNQLPMKALSAPFPQGGRRVIFVSSDHEDASATVAKLVEDLGYAPVEVGRLAEGGRLIQARAPLVFQDLIKFN